MGLDYYQIVIAPYTFFVQVELEDDDMYFIRLGTPELQDCGSIQVYRDHHVAELHGLVYNQLCAINVPLRREDQGTQKMVRALLAITCHLFPFITHFQLTDTSVIDCHAMSKSVYLQDMYFYRYGTTWYEKHFGAESDWTQYSELKRAFSQKPALPFSRIWKYIPNSQRKHKATVERIYEQSASWHDFFQQWWQVDGCTPFMYIHGQQRSMMHEIFPSTRKTLYGSTWFIDRNQCVSLNDINIQKVERPLKMQWRVQKKEPLRRLFSGGLMHFGPDSAQWYAS